MIYDFAYSIATDKILIDNKKEIETLQEKTTLLTLELKNREEKINQLIEKMKGREKYMIFYLFCNVIIRSAVWDSRSKCLGQVYQSRVKSKT